MPWVRLDDTFAEDIRLERAGPLALALHVAATCYCSRQLTDGRLTWGVARRLLALDDCDGVIESLLAEGLWHRDGADHLRLVDFLENQPSAEKVKAQRAEKKARQTRWINNKRKASQASSQDASRDDAPNPPRPAPKGGAEGLGGHSEPRSSASATAGAATDPLNDDDNGAVIAEVNQLLSGVQIEVLA